MKRAGRAQTARWERGVLRLRTGSHGQMEISGLSASLADKPLHNYEYVDNKGRFNYYICARAAARCDSHRKIRLHKRIDNCAKRSRETPVYCL